ncbi:HIT family protein [Asticcacaulis tiandongensis]|uniref:HIT family protein n=1 Tax=Asticcacaulis tiandongensis TaxID=2565365 RepID=UPI00112A15EE|nr:HIT family protein [Asticcacaulis tiandongensis]
MSLTGTYDPQNIFAKIIRGEIPAVKVYEDDTVLSFMDVFPQSEGHTLVIPKSEARNLLDIAPDALQNLIVKTQLVAQAVNKALTPDGIRIAQFNGEPAGQTVFHIHFHIIPAYDSQSEAPHASGQMADTDKLKALAERIKAEL